MKLQVTMTVETPSTPNFLRTGDGKTVQLCDVTDDGLREVAKLWTDALIHKAHEQHKNKYGTKR